MNTNNLKVKAYKFDRNDEILELLNRVFKPWGGDEAIFKWKYLQYQPDGCNFPRGWIIEKNGDIVAFNGYLPRKLKYGKKHCWILQSFDTVTDPACRGKGLFGKIQKHVYEEMKSMDIPWVYGWTSEIGYKVFTKKVGWAVWANQRYLMRALDSRKFLKEKLSIRHLAEPASWIMDRIKKSALIPDGWRGEIKFETDFPDSIDVFVDDINSKFDMIVIRDKEYLNWRLSKPGAGQKLLCAYEDKQLSAYIVYAVGDDIVEIFDCLWRSRDSMLALLASIENLSLQSGCQTIKFRINDKFTGAKVFKGAGFFFSRTTFPLLGKSVIFNHDIEEFFKNRDFKFYWSMFDRNE